ncbi:MAG: protein kinase [Gemmatimonadales bacterium]
MNDGSPPRAEKDALRGRVQQAVGALFEVEEEIGRGGMAVVYRARDVKLHRRVALKVLPPELAFRDDVKRRFLREAQMAAQLSHPNIVPIFAVDELEGIVYFAMGLVEGETLARLLSRQPRPGVDVIRRLLREVAEALAYAHAHGVVHRDVKPDNILVEQATGRALVSDFGIARAMEGDARLTMTGNAVGTPAYMSPEQAMGEREVDGRSDIYSLGIVGYQMLAGALPFEAANTPAMLMKHISERPRPLHELCSDAPANLVHAIERAMAKGRGERWPDAASFGEALAEGAPTPERLEESPGAAVQPRDSAGDRASYGADLALRINGRVLGSIGIMGRSRRQEDEQPAVGAATFPRFPALPPNWMFRPDTREYGREALKEWREQQRLWRQRNRDAPPDPSSMSRREIRRAMRQGLLGPVTPEERIRRVQRSIVSFATTTVFLATINAVTSPRFPWFIFPMLAMGIGLVSRISSLWVDGISIRRLFQRQPHLDQSSANEPESAERSSRHDRAAPAPARPLIAAADLAGLPADVLHGPHGEKIREAAQSKAIIMDVLAKLPPADRQLLPEIQPTVDALVERVRSLALALSQNEADASADPNANLERRIADTRETAADAPDRERRLQLLERQHATLKDLASRRDAVAQQLESAWLVLQTMKLDLLKLRSSGLDAKLDASSGATQEARALSTDIGRVIEAANEVRKL